MLKLSEPLFRTQLHCSGCFSVMSTCRPVGQISKLSLGPRCSLPGPSSPGCSWLPWGPLSEIHATEQPSHHYSALNKSLQGLKRKGKKNQVADLMKIFAYHMPDKRLVPEDNGLWKEDVALQWEKETEKQWVPSEFWPYALVSWDVASWAPSTTMWSQAQWIMISV